MPTELKRDCHVDIALRWGTGYETVMRSFVNIISTPKGGSHQAGFDQGMLKFLRQQIEQNARRLKVGNDKLEKDDILAGLTAVLTVRLPEPQFEGQTKEILGTPGVRNIVANVIAKTMGERFTSTKRFGAGRAANGAICWPTTSMNCTASTVPSRTVFCLWSRTALSRSSVPPRKIRHSR